MNSYHEGNIVVRAETHDALLRAVSVWIAKDHGRNGYSMLRFNEQNGLHWVHHDLSASESLDIEPTFRLPTDVATVLAKALLGQNPVTDVGFSQLQQTLQLESTRVDKMLDHLIGTKQ